MLLVHSGGAEIRGMVAMGRVFIVGILPPPPGGHGDLQGQERDRAVSVGPVPSRSAFWSPQRR